MKKLALVFWLALLIKLVLASLIPLTNDEAYYWIWSQHMQWSYYDHPPFVAWLMWIGDLWQPSFTVVRWPGVLLGHGTLALWLLILKPFFTADQLLVWLLLALFSPLIGGTNMLVTPDMPLLFFYSLSLLVFYRWREHPRPWWALAFGLSLGLGFCSKYVMVLFPVSLLPLVLLSRRVRQPFVRHLGWIILGGLIGTFPVWWWNAHNGFVSLRYQAEHGLGGTVWKPHWTIEYVLAQVGLIFPTVLYWAVRARRRLPVVFHLMAWVPMVFFLVTTSRGYVEANWPLVAYPALFALAVASWPRNALALRATLGLWATAVLGLAVIILAHPRWSAKTKFRDFNQFSSLMEPVSKLEPVFARSYQMASKLSFDLRHPIYKLKGMNRKDFFDYLPESEPHTPLFYLAVEKGDALPIQYSSRGYQIIATQMVDDQFEIWTVKAP